MKKVVKFFLIAFVGIVLASCNNFIPQPEFQLSDLQGLWLQNNDTTEHYVRFTSEQSDETGYLYGREWNEYYGDDEFAVYELDLLNQRTRDGFPGNGWFKYRFETTGSLTEIHLMENGGADIPKVYIVTKLSDTALEYYEKEQKKNTFSFTKVVETK